MRAGCAYDPREASVSAFAQLRSAILYKFLDGSFHVIGTVFGFKFWTVGLPVRGNLNTVDPQYEQRIKGHKNLGFVRGMTGANYVRSTVADQRPKNILTRGGSVHALTVGSAEVIYRRHSPWCDNWHFEADVDWTNFASCLCRL